MHVRGAYTVDNAETLFVLDQWCVHLSHTWRAMLQDHPLYMITLQVQHD